MNEGQSFSATCFVLSDIQIVSSLGQRLLSFFICLYSAQHIGALILDRGFLGAIIIQMNKK